MKRQVLLFCVGLAISCQVQAQYQLADTLATRQLDELVFTGQFEPQSAQKSVYKVRTISMEKIQARGAVRLQDVLNTELNIRFSQDMALGGSNLTMQGLAGQNVKVLIDGVPMVGRQGTSNEININQINVNSIERVEIVEGPMSVVYGADALAGVINIITKKTNDGKLDLTARVHEETVGKEYGWSQGIHNESIGGGYSWKKFYVRGDISRNYFGGWKGDSTGRERQWHPKSQWLGNATVGVNGDNLSAYYRADYLNEIITNPSNFANSQANETIDQDYLTRRLMQQLQASYKFNSSLNLSSAVSYTNYSRETESSIYYRSGDRRLAPATLQETTRFNGLTVRSMLHYKLNDNFSFQPGFDINVEDGEGGRISGGVRSIGDYAGFVSAEWKLGKWQVRPGVRTVYNSVYQSPPFTPSLNLKWTVSKLHDIKVSYGRGFRAPSLRELYFNFIDASHTIYGNEDLKAELSDSFNGSWTWTIADASQQKLSSSLGGFYNSVSNMIGYAIKYVNGVQATSYMNIDKYKTKGITWNNKFQVNALEGSVGVAYTGRYNQLFESAPGTEEFVWSPEITSNASYNFRKIGLLISLYHKYTGSTPIYEIVSINGEEVTNLAKIGAYQWADLTVKKNFGTQFSVTAGARNLFDITNVQNSSLATGGVHSGGNARPVGNGRSYFLSLNYSLFKFE